jgi:hypothetical protein
MALHAKILTAKLGLAKLLNPHTSDYNGWPCQSVPQARIEECKQHAYQKATRWPVIISSGTTIGSSHVSQDQDRPHASSLKVECLPTVIVPSPCLCPL